jgi:transcriptional regulator with XRE-family HTH domain
VTPFAHIPGMGTRSRPGERGREQARHIVRRTGQDIRVARHGAGVSIRAAAAAVGLSASVFGRIERGDLHNATVLQLSLACAAMGLEFSGRSYPSGDPVRDRAHVQLLVRLHEALPVGCPWRTEVPLAIPGDLRSLDAVTELAGRRIGIEAETRLADLQAVERRAQLKKRDARLDVLVLLVADTRRNREVLRLHRDGLRTSFPLGTRRVLAAMRMGEPPPANGIVLL